MSFYPKIIHYYRLHTGWGEVFVKYLIKIINIQFSTWDGILPITRPSEMLTSFSKLNCPEETYSCSLEPCWKWRILRFPEKGKYIIGSFSSSHPKFYIPTKPVSLCLAQKAKNTVLENVKNSLSNGQVNSTPKKFEWPTILKRLYWNVWVMCRCVWNDHSWKMDFWNFSTTNLKKKTPLALTSGARRGPFL